MSAAATGRTSSDQDVPDDPAGSEAAERPVGLGIVRDSVGDMTITTRTLGDTGAKVTVLGYGAMKLRGRPRGPELMTRGRHDPREDHANRFKRITK